MIVNAVSKRRTHAETGSAWILGLVIVTGCAQSPPTSDVSRQIERLRVEPAVGSERLTERKSVEQFYKDRDARPAWLDRSGDVVKAIQGVQADGLDPADYHLEAIQSLIADPPAQRTPESQAKLDVLLSDAVAGLADHVRYGRVHPAQVNAAWNDDPRDAAPPLDSTLSALAGSGSVDHAIESQRPQHFIYRGLTAELERLRRIESHGGWPTVPTGRALTPGTRDRRVPILRRRLAVGGEYSGSLAGVDSTRYDPALVSAVKNFQSHHRLNESGAVDAATIAVMNVDIATRIGQVRANLERARWVLGGLGDDFLLVNLPAFKAYLIRGNRNVWEARTQIGQEALQTPTFRAEVRTVVFNPDWTVPKSILVNEIIPQMRAGKNVVAEQHLEFFDAKNQPVDGSSIDWQNADSTNFNYDAKQPPGPDNALGKVKFLFPNKYSIYLYDTPHQGNFDATKRMFSHGCIRVEHAVDLAQLLLQGQGDWDRGKMDEVMATNATTNVTVERPLPILIVYWTVSVGAAGDVRYADDIYHLDAPLVEALDRRR
jgi:murein L,D-transpeptidase YcbB/YkuD